MERGGQQPNKSLKILAGNVVPSTPFRWCVAMLGGQYSIRGYAGQVIVLTALFQGLNARYYFARSQRVKDYLKETPGWIVEIQRSTSTL